MQHIRTRFAPSPTGFMHVGGVRTALFAWLVARQNNGVFILRIEDTDKEREVEGSDMHIQESLSWLGLNWDEGPFYQSQRLDIYKKYAQQLIDSGRAYADPYSKEELEAFRQKAKAEKRPFLYRDHRPENPPEWDGTMPLRFKSSVASWNVKDEIIPPTNEVYAGLENYPPEALDDFILIKSDGYPTYNFAHIIDDHEMGVTHVIRGQEFLSSMPKYHDLLTALNFEIPKMYTLPHVMAEGGKKKLGKRDGAKDILAYRDEGYLPEAMVNFLATLGWNDGTEQEVYTVPELIDKFNIDDIQKSGAQFDEKRLVWLNGQHIRMLSVDDLYERVNNFWPHEAASFDVPYKKQVLKLVQDRLKTLSDLPILSSFFFKEPEADLSLIDSNKQLQKLSAEQRRELLVAAIEELEKSDFSESDLTNRLNGLLESTAQKPAVLFGLIRIALTWAPFSPGLAETMNVLGKEGSLGRIKKSLGNI